MLSEDRAKQNENLHTLRKETLTFVIIRKDSDLRWNVRPVRLVDLNLKSCILPQVPPIWLPHLLSLEKHSSFTLTISTHFTYTESALVDCRYYVSWNQSWPGSLGGNVIVWSEGKQKGCDWLLLCAILCVYKEHKSPKTSLDRAGIRVCHSKEWKWMILWMDGLTWSGNQVDYKNTTPDSSLCVMI